MAPGIEGIKNGVRVSWDELLLRIEVLNLTPRRIGIQADICIFRNGFLIDYSVQNIIDTQKTLNLSRKMAKLCKLEETSWESILTTAFLLAQKHLQEQNPIYEIEELTLIKKEFHWICKPFVAKGLPTILFGPGGTGKSKFAMWLSCLIQNGISMEPWIYVPQARNVLYLDWESDPEEAGWLASGLRQANQEIVSLPMYRRCEQPISGEALRINKIIEDTKAEVLIIDSLALACGGDPMAPETAFSFFRTLRFMQVDVLLLAHPPKTTEQGRLSDVFGSTFFQNLTRSVWEMQHAGVASHLIGLFHRKCNYSSKFRPQAWEFAYSHDPWSIEIAQRELWGTDLESRLSLGDRIEHLLQGQTGMTAKDISESIYSDPKKWKSIWKCMSDDSRFDCEPTGKPDEVSWWVTIPGGQSA